jgi:hypothetical protein
MENEYLESWAKLSQSLVKPLSDLAELNIKTLNKLVKNEDFATFSQAKKPEDFLAAQTKFVNAASLETIKHTQEVCGILMTAATQTGKVVEEMIRKATVKSADMAQSGINKVKEKVQGQ